MVDSGCGGVRTIAVQACIYCLLLALLTGVAGCGTASSGAAAAIHDAGALDSNEASSFPAASLPMQMGDALLTNCSAPDGLLELEVAATPVLVLSSFSHARLDFRLEGQAPGAVVEITVPVELSGLTWEEEEGTGAAEAAEGADAAKAEETAKTAESGNNGHSRILMPGLRLTVTDASDMNGTRVSGLAMIGEESKLVRVAKVSPEGALSFAAFIGNEELLAMGRVRLGVVRVRQVSDHPDYVRVASADGSLGMTLRTADVTAAAVPMPRLQRWIDLLAEFHAGMLQMGAAHGTVTAPVEMIATEVFGFQGLAGDPVYLNADILGANLAKLRLDGPVEEQNVLWACVHEMGHLCDMERTTGAPAPWNFDPELLANLRAIRVISAKGCGLGGDAHVGDRVPERFSEERKAFAKGIYSSEGLMCALMEISLGVGDQEPWRLLEETLAACVETYGVEGVMSANNASGAYSPAASNNANAADARFRNFLAVFEQQLGARLSDRLTDAEWRAVAAKFHILK